MQAGKAVVVDKQTNKPILCVWLYKAFISMLVYGIEWVHACVCVCVVMRKTSHQQLISCKMSVRESMSMSISADMLCKHFCYVRHKLLAMTMSLTHRHCNSSLSVCFQSLFFIQFVRFSSPYPPPTAPHPTIFRIFTFVLKFRKFKAGFWLKI